MKIYAGPNRTTRDASTRSKGAATDSNLGTGINMVSTAENRAPNLERFLRDFPNEIIW